MEDQISCLAEGQLVEYLEGRLPDRQRSAVEKHSARCTKCRTRLVEQFEFNRERVVSSLTPNEIVQRVQALSQTEPPQREIPADLEPRNWPRIWALIFILVVLVLLTFAYFMGVI